MSSGIIVSVSNFLTSLGAITNGGITGDTPCVPKINSPICLPGGVLSK